MNRRTAIATAAAATMSLLSGFVAVGAHTGALGIGGSPPAAVAQPAAATADAPVAAPDMANPTRADRSAAATPTGDRDQEHDEEREHEHDEEHEHEYEGRDSDD